LPETLPASQRQPLAVRSQLSVLSELVRDPPFTRYVLSGAFHFAALFAYITASSFVLQEVYGLSAQQYSVVFSVNGVGLVLVSQLNALLVGRVADEQALLRSGSAVGAVGGLGALTCSVLRAPLAPLLVCLFLVVATLGPVFANSTSLALSRHGDAAGAASSLMGLPQFGVAAIAGAVSGSSALSMGATMCVATLGAVTVSWLGRPVTRLRRSSARSAGGTADGARPRRPSLDVTTMSAHPAKEEA
jgi:DHA1 family bicyclomycin/chloramphenicol resistance-like MFS transporter